MEPGAVRLRVADLDRQRSFYERAIGLRAIESRDGLVRLGVDGVPVVDLADGPDAPPRPRRTTGLFHLAILVPGRAELAESLTRVARAGWRLTGASDHLVSEALYVDDPEGNGIELYRDRPRAEWPYEEGRVQMATQPLDLDDLLVQPGASERANGMRPGTRIGHVHLNVANVDDAEAFYAGLLGFDVTVRGYPGALFLSIGGYHHHIGVNTWAGAGAPAPPRGSRGLEWFELQVDAGRAGELEQKLREAGVDADPVADGLLVHDPSGNGVLIKGASAPG